MRGASRRWRALPVLMLTVAALATASLVAAPAPRASAEFPTALRVVMVSDSVGLGAVNAINSVFAGWQVTVTGKPGLFTEQLVSYASSLPASAFGDTAVVATGYNYPYWDPARFDASIDQMVGALVARGVQRIFWVTMREVKPAYYASWNGLTDAYRTLYLAYPGANDQLRLATLRHPQLSIVDWASIADQPGITYDAIHLNPTGAAKYAGLIASAVFNAHTRPAAGTVTTVPVAGVAGVPAEAVAVALNLTAVNPRTSGFLAVYPCGGDPPVVSNLNYRAGYTVASSALVPIGAGGAVCVLQSSAGHVLVDVTGAFTPGSGFVAVAPQRAVDTRLTFMPASGQVTVAHLGTLAGTPPGRFTAVVNLTGIANADTELRITGCDTTPSAAATRTVEARLVQTLNLLVETDVNGDVCITTTGNAHVLLDLFGAFPAGSPAHAQGTVPVFDSRYSTALLPGTDRVVAVAADAPGAVPLDPLPAGAVLTVSAIGPTSNGFVTVFPCSAGGTPTSVVNVLPNHGQANTVVVGPDPGGTVCARSSVATHLDIAVTGWFTSGYRPLAPARLVDTRL